MDGDYTGAEHAYIVKTLDFISKQQTFVEWRYQLPFKVQKKLFDMKSPMSGDAYRESIYVSKYSRSTNRPRGPIRRSEPYSHFTAPPSWMSTPQRDAEPISRRETWADTVIRVIEGTASCEISHKKRYNIPFDIKDLDIFYEKMAYSMFRFEHHPPGRGLFIMGTEYMYNNGNFALNNCYAVDLTNNLVKALSWAMDMSMGGGGDGGGIKKGSTINVIRPDKNDPLFFTVPDTRQGWIAAMELMLRAWIPVDGEITNKYPIFDFSLIRPKGTKINGFGGTSSGPDPLIKFLQRIELYCESFLEYSELTAAGLSGVPAEEVKFHTRLCRRMRDLGLHVDYFGNEVSDEIYNEILDKVTKISSKKVFKYDTTRFIADLFNSVGVCVGSGNVRRSAQILLGDAGDETFRTLKDKENLLRVGIGHASNNTVRFWTNEDFENYLDEIVRHAIYNDGEPGIANMKAIQDNGRIGDSMEKLCEQWGLTSHVKRCITAHVEENNVELSESDKNYNDISDIKVLIQMCKRLGAKIKEFAFLLNPCGEENLEDYEPCCLGTVIPVNCVIDGVLLEDRVREACEFATHYATVVNTVPHHWEETRKIIDLNNRIGISFGGVSDMFDVISEVTENGKLEGSYTKMTTLNRKMYTWIRTKNCQLSKELRRNPSIKVTTVKPEGTTAIIAGVSSGVHFPIISQGIRRVTYDKTEAIFELLKSVGYCWEQKDGDKDKAFILFPYKSHTLRNCRSVSIEEKFVLVHMLQEHFADCSVSFTGDFKEGEEEDRVAIQIVFGIKRLKAVSVLPQANSYHQAPYEQTDDARFAEISANIKPIDWDKFYSNDKADDISSEGVKGCVGDYCEIRLKRSTDDAIAASSTDR